MTAIAIAHSSFGASSRPPDGISERGEEREPEDDDARAEDLTTTDVLSGQEVAEGEREHDGRDEQRLDDRQPSPVERSSLRQIPDEERDGAEEPPLLLDEPDQRHRVSQRDLVEVEGTSLLERRRERKQKRRHEGQDRRHPAGS